jgi:hypothetical protein
VELTLASCHARNLFKPKLWLTPTCGDRGAKAALREQESAFKVALREKALKPDLLAIRSRPMARKPASRSEFVLFDVIYEDGSQRSNRRVPIEVLGGLDADAPARAVIEEQDREIAEKSGMPPLRIKSLKRSGKK